VQPLSVVDGTYQPNGQSRAYTVEQEFLGGIEDFLLFF
jgi:hypothetical protein